MYIMYIVLSCRYANHVSISQFIRANHEDECKLPPTIYTPSIFGKIFSFDEERIMSICYHGIAFSCCIITELKILT
jgi:hypothetical protein